MNKYSLKNKKYTFISLIIMIILWQTLAATINNELLFPSIISILKEMIVILSDNSFFYVIIASVGRCLLCFIISITISVLISSLSYINKFVYNFFYPVMMIIKAIPTIAFIVLALIWISKEYAPIVIGLMMAIPIFYDVILNALVEIDDNIIEVFDVYRVGKMERIKNLYLPTIISSVAGVFSSTIALILKVIIAGELYSQPRYGIGAIIQMEKMRFNTTAIITWILLITLITLVFDKMLSILNNSINIWKVGEKNKN